MTKQPITVRQAVRHAIRLNRIAKETGNPGLYAVTREYIRNMYRSRNSKVVVPLLFYAVAKQAHA